MTERKLTAKQEKFVEGIVAGLTQKEAYIAAYNTKNMKGKSIIAKASDEALKPIISEEIARRKKQIADLNLWTREQALETLATIIKETRPQINIEVEEVVRGKPTKTVVHNPNAANTVIKALTEANKMCGYNAPIEIKSDNIIRIELEGEIEDWAK